MRPTSERASEQEKERGGKERDESFESPINFGHCEQDIAAAVESSRRAFCSAGNGATPSRAILLPPTVFEHPRPFPSCTLSSFSSCSSSTSSTSSYSSSSSVVLPFRSTVSSRPSRAWAVDNVIYTGRVINVLGDRRFKKAIGNRRQRRATVSPPPAAATAATAVAATTTRDDKLLREFARPLPCFLFSSPFFFVFLPRDRDERCSSSRLILHDFGMGTLSSRRSLIVRSFQPTTSIAPLRFCAFFMRIFELKFLRYRRESIIEKFQLDIAKKISS